MANLIWKKPKQACELKLKLCNCCYNKECSLTKGAILYAHLCFNSTNAMCESSVYVFVWQFTSLQDWQVICKLRATFDVQGSHLKTKVEVGIKCLSFKHVSQRETNVIITMPTATTIYIKQFEFHAHTDRINIIYNVTITVHSSPSEVKSCTSGGSAGRTLYKEERESEVEF